MSSVWILTVCVSLLWGGCKTFEYPTEASCVAAKKELKETYFATCSLKKEKQP